MKKLFHLLGCHSFANSIKVDFQGNPADYGFCDKKYTPMVFSPVVLIENRYKCLDCGKLYWYAPSDHEMLAMYENLEKHLTTALEKRN